ncbi:hypothetical protein PtrV1_13443 [Pyrenophora tritici-repentis]|nr:hypothetical protein PtrV1_13443 [Pyrenophora tritici-repentis]
MRQESCAQAFTISLKKGKALDLQQRQEYHGGSVFWSPHKLREARAREAVRERDETEEKLQKARSKKQREEARLQRQDELEERHHLTINLKAAWRKADAYYLKLDDSPAYYVAVCLYLYYKHYCENSWADKAGRPSTLSDIDDAIKALVSYNKGSSELNLDEYEQWRKYEPMWTKKQYNNGNVHLAARGGFTIPEKAAAAYTDEEMAMKYGVDDWDEPSQ